MARLRGRSSGSVQCRMESRKFLRTFSPGRGDEYGSEYEEALTYLSGNWKQRLARKRRASAIASPSRFARTARQAKPAEVLWSPQLSAASRAAVQQKGHSPRRGLFSSPLQRRLCVEKVGIVVKMRVRRTRQFREISQLGREKLPSEVLPVNSCFPALARSCPASAKTADVTCTCSAHTIITCFFLPGTSI
jgi:hypothetical protein